MRKKLLLGFIIGLICSANSIAQITVRGKIIEKGTGESLPSATVLEVGTQNGTSSNLEGFFTLFNLSSDTATIQISFVGFETVRIKLDAERIKTRLLIELNPASSDFGEIVVTADSYNLINASAGISKTTVSPKQLALLPAIGEADIFRSLQLLPGVSGTNENSSGLFIRGGTPDQNLVILDGMTVYKVDHFFGFFSAFNSNAIKDVQIFKGTFPAKYGGRTSSVVDLTGKSGSTQGIQGGANVNLLSAGFYLEAPLTKKVSLITSARRSYTDVLQSGIFNSITDNLLGDDDIPNPNGAFNINQVEPEFYFYDVNARMTYRPTINDAVTISFYNGQDFLDESRNANRTFTVGPNNPIQGDRFLTANVDELTDWGNIGSSLKWTRQWNDRLFTDVLVAGSEYFSNYDRSVLIQNTIPDQDTTLFALRQGSFEDNNVRDLSFRLDTEWQPVRNHKFQFGINLTRSQVDYSNTRNDTLTILRREQEADLIAGYISDEWTVNSRLTINPGLRLSYYEFNDLPLLSPRVSGFYQLTSAIKLKAAYGRHYQFVNRIINENVTEGSRDFWLLTDNQLVNTSLSDNVVGGVSYETNRWLFDIETYYKKFENLSEFSLRFRRGININSSELFFTGSGEASGAEFLIQRKQGNYNGWVSYTFSSIANTFDAFNDGEPFPALHDQRHEVKFVHSYGYQGWNFATTFIYGSGKPFSEPEGEYTIELLDGRRLTYVGVGEKNGSRIPAYHRLDFSVHRKVPVGSATADIGFSIFNLYNRNNIWYFEYDFSQDPFLTTEITYLGVTPNISLNIDF